METIDLTAAIKRRQLEIRKLKRLGAPLRELIEDARRAAFGESPRLTNSQWAKKRDALVEKLFDLGIFKPHYQDFDGNTLQTAVPAPYVWDQVEII